METKGKGYYCFRDAADTVVVIVVVDEENNDDDGDDCDVISDATS